VSVIHTNRFPGERTSQALRDERKAPDSRWLPPHEADALREYARERDEIIEVLFGVICTLKKRADA
jgi:hypothetical protein